MKFIIEHFSFAQLTWLVVISYAFHYMEEGPRLSNWLNANFKKVKETGMVYTQTKLNVENIIMFSLTLLSVILLNVHPGSWLLQAITIGWSFGLLGNTWFHALPTLRDGLYSPGVVTAAFFFPVTTIILVEKAMLDGFLSIPMVIFSVVWGPAGYLGLIIFTHKVIFRNRVVGTAR